jgi:hypothetical protein
MRDSSEMNMQKGAKAIDQFQSGDQIVFRAENNVEGLLEVQVVEEVFVRVAPIFEVRVRGRTIHTTAEHPFFA